MELEFLQAKPAEKGADVFPAQLSLEDFFRMHPLHRGWRERYPAERAEKLSGLLREIKRQESDLNTRFTETEGKKNNTNNEFQAFLAQKNNWLEKARFHDAMCNGGCREFVCSSNN